MEMNTLKAILRSTVTYVCVYQGLIENQKSNTNMVAYLRWSTWYELRALDRRQIKNTKSKEIYRAKMYTWLEKEDNWVSENTYNELKRRMQ